MSSRGQFEEVAYLKLWKYLNSLNRLDSRGYITNYNISIHWNNKEQSGAELFS